jgi:hypothetical protein
VKGRSVIEIMVLVFTFVVAFAILATGLLISVIEVRDPTADTSSLVRTLSTIITLILGALLGMLAGKTDVINDLSYRPGDDPRLQSDALSPAKEEGR